MSIRDLAVVTDDPHTIQGHPVIPLFGANGDVIKMITVCSECGSLRTIIMLVGDKWYCSACRTEGNTRNTKMFPIS